MIVLDTHIWVWWTHGDPQLPESHRARVPTFFKSPAEFGRWLKKNHATASEVWVGYYKKDTGKPRSVWNAVNIPQFTRAIKPK